MAEYFTWSKLFEAGGVTLIVLLVCSIVSFIVIIERAIYFQSRTIDGGTLLEKIRERLESGDFPGAGNLMQSEKSPAGYVLGECLEAVPGGHLDDLLFEEVKSRAIAEKIPEMERYLNIEATLGTVSPFIGLLGTILGIIRSFQSLGGAQSASGISGLNAGIAEALVATAAGLFVAIPATIAYNYFRKRVGGLVMESEIAASRLKVMLHRRKGGAG